MSAHRLWMLLALVSIAASFRESTLAGDPQPPSIQGISSTNGQKKIHWTPYPAAQHYKLFRAEDLYHPFVEDTSGSIAGFDWESPTAGPLGFYRLQVVSLDSSALLVATVLNRLAYGPTPDELERVTAIGPQAYIEEQMRPELIDDNLPFETVTPDFGSGWQPFTATGIANTSGTGTNFYIYLNVPGDCFLDDIRLVAGTNPGVGANLIRDGDFEQPLNANDWVVSANHAASAITTGVSHSGSASLHVIASSAGTTRDSAIWQPVIGLVNNQRYTLSYWFLPSTNNQLGSVTVRFSGSWISSAPFPLSLLTKLDNGIASLQDLRAFHVLRAVQSRRQLLEVLDQFLENHFVTQQSKSREYFDTYYDDGARIDQLATQLEYKENKRWRRALLNPQCTFYDLSRISAESPAMIIYLDTVNSKGNVPNIANENYARELLELFSFGVDNGYDQADIVQMSRAWTGWSVNLVDVTNEFNPFAPRTTKVLPGVTSNFSAVTNLAGVWAFNYKSGNHYTNSKSIFYNRDANGNITGPKIVPARFGPPWAGKTYDLFLPGRRGTNGIQDGYDVLAHLANQPFAQEYISIKLCRLFVHDDFPNPSNDPASEAYAFYDYAGGSLSPEAELVHQCMLAWENSNPRGQIREVLNAIFSSDLFRRHGASMQKVKTPLEFTVSAIRALRSAGANGTYTADTDGYSLVVINGSASLAPLGRLGGMALFDRAEPNGYAEAGPPWISAGTLAERLRFVQGFLIATNQSGRADVGNCACNPVALLQSRLPNTSWKDAGAVADFFLRILFPAEGTANLDLYRAQAIRFLNTADDGKSASPFSSLPVSSTAGATYDTRVRGMVAMLMTSPRFQEQ